MEPMRIKPPPRKKKKSMKKAGTYESYVAVQQVADICAKLLKALIYTQNLNEWFSRCVDHLLRDIPARCYYIEKPPLLLPKYAESLL